MFYFCSHIEKETAELCAFNDAVMLLVNGQRSRAGRRFSGASLGNGVAKGSQESNFWRGLLATH
jgi:hypothetical protein